MRANRVRDFALYVAIGLLAGLLVMWLAFHNDRFGLRSIQVAGLRRGHGDCFRLHDQAESHPLEAGLILVDDVSAVIRARVRVRHRSAANR